MSNVIDEREWPLGVITLAAGKRFPGSSDLHELLFQPAVYIPKTFDPQATGSGEVVGVYRDRLCCSLVYQVDVDGCRRTNTVEVPIADLEAATNMKIHVRFPSVLSRVTYISPEVVLVAVAIMGFMRGCLQSEKNAHQKSFSGKAIPLKVRQ